jgi:hypothetical protein
MKKLILTLGIAFLSFGALKAQNADEDRQRLDDRIEKTEIRAEDLPTAVQASMEIRDLDTEEIIEAYEVTEGDDTYYEIHIREEGRKEIIYMDEIGRLVDEKEVIKEKEEEK